MYSGRWYPGPAVDFTLGESSDTTVGQIMNQMAILRTEMQKAQASGNTTLQSQLAAAYRSLDTLRQRAVAAATKGDDLTAIDRAVLQTGDYVSQVVDNVPGAIAKLAGSIGVGVLGGMLPWLLIAAAVIMVKREARK